MKQYKKLALLISIFSILTALLLIKAAAASQAYGAGTVSASALNIRTEPGTTGGIAATLKKGSSVVILDISNSDWYHVNSGGTDGYVAALYLSDVGTVKNFAASGLLTSDDVRLRGTPSTAGAVLGTYPAGTAVSIIGINTGWYKVQCAGITGYVRSDFIVLSSNAFTASALSAASSRGQEIADYARQFLGYRYIYGAASPRIGGFDCSGLTYYVFRQFGYSISRTASQQYKNNGVSVAKSDLQPGDLVFFSRNGGRSVTHVGLYYGDGKFVNASTERTGVILSSLESGWYEKTWYGAKRIIG
jgi:cell wall-associated NlpC family hydrolase